MEDEHIQAELMKEEARILEEKEAEEQERLEKIAEFDRQIAILMAQKTQFLSAGHLEAASIGKGF